MKPRASALIPFVIFAVFYVGLSLYAGNQGFDMPWYKVPMPIAFIVASAFAFLWGKQTLEQKVDTYAKGMLQENEVEGIISPSFVQKDEKRQLKYKVTSMISLKDFLMHPMEKESLITIIRSVMNASASLSEYMLSEDSLLLDPEYFYFSLNGRNVVADIADIGRISKINGRFHLLWNIAVCAKRFSLMRRSFCCIFKDFIDKLFLIRGKNDTSA